MRKKLSTLGLLALLFVAPAAADDLTDDQLLYRFAVYTIDAYLGDSLKGTDPNQLSPTVAARILTPRLLGYSLGNLLRHAQPGSDNHRIWQRLESRVRKALFELIDLQGAQERWIADHILVRKQIAGQEFAWAIEHRYDVEMARAYGVSPDQAPDFFASLTPTPPQPPAGPPPLPPVVLSDPTPPASDDAVPGVYKVVGQSWENDPNCGSEVKITGTMNEVEAAFKLWDRTGVTWDYKGTAKWDGRSGTTTNRDLKGKTQWLTYPHVWHELTIRIARGADGVWRAASINIGGNFFQLADNRVAGRLVTHQRKTLTIRNTTRARVSIYLDVSEEGLKTLLGSVEPGSEMKFIGIPEQGLRHLKIVPAPDTYPYMYTESMVISETRYDYFFEVLEWHLKQR